MIAARSLRITEHNWLVYRRVWRGTLMVSFIGPLLFLASMGLGLGSLVQRGSGGVAGVSYLDFIAPGLLAASAMQTAVMETGYPMLGKIIWQKTYEAALSTPIGVTDLVTGEVAWQVVRVGISASLFFVVTVLFGAVHSLAGVVAIPGGILTGLAFSTPMMSVTARLRRDSAISGVFRFVVLPLFLLSGTFFPVDRLPVVLQLIAWTLPLAQGIAVTRDATLGRLGGADLVHIAVLLIWIAAGWALTTVLLRRRLVR